MIKYFFLIVMGMCFLVNDVYTQDQKVIDSLNAALTGKTGGERFPALYELTFQYILKDNEKALEYIRPAEEATLISGNSLRLVRSNFQISIAINCRVWTDFEFRDRPVIRLN